MIDANSRLESRECNLCGKKRECFVQYKYGQEQAVCRFCLSVIYCY